MVVVMQPGAHESQIEAVVECLNKFGFEVHRMTGVSHIVLGAIGVKRDLDIRNIKVLDGVADVFRVTEPYKFASRAWKPEKTVVDVRGVKVGGDELAIMAGPCAVESKEQIEQTATHIASLGARFLRGAPSSPGRRRIRFKGWVKPVCKCSRRRLTNTTFVL